MDESVRTADFYLRDVSTRLRGPLQPRKRLLTEIRDHLDDAITANLNAGMQAVEAEQRAVEQLGPPAALTEAWQARCSRLRTRRRGHIAMLVGAAAAAAVLGIAQHAQGRRDPTTPTRSCSAEKAIRTGPECGQNTPTSSTTVAH